MIKLHNENYPLVEIAPNVFVKSWGDVRCGYVHGQGSYRQFVIKLSDGEVISLQNPKEIVSALKIWRINARQYNVDNTNPLNTRWRGVADAGN